MDIHSRKLESSFDLYTKSTLCMYGRLQILLRLIESKLGKYGFTYTMQPQTISFIKEEIFTEYITTKNIEMIMYELESIQDSISIFKGKKNKIVSILHTQMNKEIYHLYRHIHYIMNMYQNYRNDSRVEDI